MITIHAAAKLNLTLDVTGVRADGYHLLDSVMQSVSLYNTLTIKKSEGLTLLCDDPNLPTDARNTAYRAAELFYKTSGITPFAEMALTKRVPYQAGMGSASCDAAAALYGLNLLHDRPFCDDELLSLGRCIGADVPFALCGSTMQAKGIGDEFTVLAPLPECYFVVVFEGVAMSTPEAYRALDALGESSQRYTPAMLAAIETGKLEAIASACGNAFSKVCHPEQTNNIALRLKALGALSASLTGSGSAVFGIFANEGVAQKAAAKFSTSFVLKPTKKSLIIE